jgi:molybdopterin converting factor small subunit
MQVTVRFAGLLRALAGTQSVSLALDDGATLRDLLRILRETLPPPFVEQVVAPLETGEGPLTLLLLNRKHLHEKDKLDRPLEDGDVLAFVTPMAGGSLKKFI